ncbi:MAG: hypothetical protein K8F91_11510 [Candidatus Obscuribacterales bacterium]|nr:hypothetical protein [Candidatus Obscuribacterales bacterium]
MIFFSSIVPHTGDFMAWGCCFFVTTLIKSASESVLQYLDPEWITSFIDRAIYVLALAGEFICSISASFLMPSLDVRNDFLAGDTALLGIVTLVSNITIALMLSIWFMNRKEVTYGSA